MKFKRYGVLLAIVSGLEVVLVLWTVLAICVDAEEIFKGLVVYSHTTVRQHLTAHIVLALVLLIPGLIFIRRASFDTVYCDEKGIKIVTRKKVFEHTWAEIYKIETITRRGMERKPKAYLLTALDGEKISVFPCAPEKFIGYVKRVAPCMSTDGCYDGPLRGL